MPTNERSTATTQLVVSTTLVPLRRSAPSEVGARPADGLSGRFVGDLHLPTVRAERAAADALAARVAELAAARAPAPGAPPDIDIREHPAASENWLG